MVGTKDFGSYDRVAVLGGVRIDVHFTPRDDRPWKGANLNHLQVELLLIF